MKAHSKWCQKGKRIVTEEPEINTLGCVTQSHLPPPPPPLTFYRWWHRQLYPPPPQKNPLSETASCQGIFSGQCSPCCCSCSVLWGLW